MHTIPVVFVISLVCALSFRTGAAGAQTTGDGEIWSFNGFGTLGAAYSDESRADYAPNPFHNPEGPGLNARWDAALDSRMALQLSVQPSPKFSAVVQVVAEKQYDTRIKPKLEWANVQYNISPSFSVRAGRIALGTYLVSDHRKVGYSLPWIRPPTELYYMVPITTSDGIDATYRLYFNEISYTAEINYGRNRLEELDGQARVPNMWGFYNRLERGPLTLHASYLSMKVVYGEVFEQLWDGFRAFGPDGERVVQDYNPSGERVPFLAAGVKYDPGAWFLMAEWGQGDTGSNFGKRKGYYVSGGYRFGSVTPFLTYARASGGQRGVDGLDVSSYPPALAPAIFTLNGTLDSIQDSYVARQQTWSIGARWDLSASFSAKVQYDRVTTRDGSIGTFRNMAPGYRPGGADVFSIALDFVF